MWEIGGNLWDKWVSRASVGELVMKHAVTEYLWEKNRDSFTWKWHGGLPYYAKFNIYKQHWTGKGDMQHLVEL